MLSPSAPPAPITRTRHDNLLDNILPLLIFSLKNGLPYSQTFSTKSIYMTPGHFSISLEHGEETAEPLDDACISSISALVQTDLAKMVASHDKPFEISHCLNFGPIRLTITGSNGMASAGSAGADASPRPSNPKPSFSGQPHIDKIGLGTIVYYQTSPSTDKQKVKICGIYYADETLKLKFPDLSVRVVPYKTLFDKAKFSFVSSDQSL